MEGYVFHPEALLDLDEIWDYLAEANPDVADRVIADIMQDLDSLVAMPNMGQRRPDLTGRPLRFLRVHRYLVAYAPEERPLWVVAVLHGRRNPRVLAAIFRDRE